MRRSRKDERGNMIVAVGVIMVLAMLSAAVVARTVAGMHSAREGQDFSGALANADAGVSDALFRLDQLGTAPAATFCVGNGPSCTVHSVPGAPGVQYVAQRDPSDPKGNTYIIKSKGMVNGQPHAVRAKVWRAYTYPFAIFTKTVLDFNGNTTNFDSGSCQGPVETVDTNNNVVCTPAADVATNGQIICHGSVSPAHQQDYYKGGGTNCQNGYLVPGSYNPLNPVIGCPAQPNVPKTPCLPATHNTCPTSAAQNYMLPATLLPGDYYCSQTDLGGGRNPTLFFPPTFTVGGVTGAVSIYLIPTDGSNITVSIADASVNTGGDPTRLGVYLAGGQVDPGNGSHSGSFTGMMWAPNAAEVNPSCNADWRGAVVANAFTCNGGPHLSVKYDTRMQSLVDEQWTIADWTEIPSTQVVLP
jgi:hypothetical protein